MNEYGRNSRLRRGQPPRRYKPLQAQTGLQASGTRNFPAGPAGLTRRTALRPVSAKQAAENRERSKIVHATFGNGQERPLCSVWQARLTIALPPLDACTRWADDANEIKRRSQGGSITDPANINTPCRPCHDVLTFTPRSQLDWAVKLGLIEDRKWNGDAA